MLNPLSLWQSKAVYNLLKEFYSANFQEYGVDKSVGGSLVDLAYSKKDLVAEETLRKEIDAIFENTKLLESKTRKEISIIDLIDLSQVEHFVDIGANKLSRVNEVATKYTALRKFTAIDVIPQVREFKYPNRCTYLQVDPNDTNYPLESNCCDFINIEFVLHHFQSEELIKSQIKTFKKILKPGGKLLLWEETFEQSVNLHELTYQNNLLGVLTDLKLTEAFYNLTEQEKFEFIIVNDWIINVNIPHMQWTGQWKKWEKWVEIFVKEGFNLEQKYNLGLRVNGRLKQGVHMLGLFTLNK